MQIENKGVVFITGATSGIGLATASYLASTGYKVYGSYRTSSNTANLDLAIQKSQGLFKKIQVDVTDEISVREGIEHIILHNRSLDVIINNAGYALTGTVESCTLRQQKALFDTNFFGAVNVIQAALPHFRMENRGQIINIGSVAGIAPFPAIEIYSASKFALRGLTESMAVTLAPFNVKVSLIEPGSIRTSAAAANQPIGNRNLEADNPYVDFHQVAHSLCEANLASGTDPIELAKFIRALIAEDRPRVCYPFGEYAVQLAESRFKDPSGCLNVANQIDSFAKCGLLPKCSRAPIFSKIQQALYQPMPSSVSEIEAEQDKLVVALPPRSDDFTARENMRAEMTPQELEEHYPNRLKIRDKGWYLLICAVEKGNIELMRYILKGKTQFFLDAAEHCGRTLLYLIACSEQIANPKAFQAAKILIDAGAKVNLARMHESGVLVTPLWSAALKIQANFELIKLLILNGGRVYMGSLDMKVRKNVHIVLNQLFEKFSVLRQGICDDQSSLHLLNTDLVKRLTLVPYRNFD